MELVIYIYIILDNQPSERIFPGCNSKKCEDNCKLYSEEGRSKCSKCSSGNYLKVERGSEFSESGSYPALEGYEAAGSPTYCIIMGCTLM